MVSLELHKCLRVTRNGQKGLFGTSELLANPFTVRLSLVMTHHKYKLIGNLYPRR